MFDFYVFVACILGFGAGVYSYNITNEAYDFIEATKRFCFGVTGMICYAFSLWCFGG